MTDLTRERATVLIADDDPSLTTLYAAWLRGTYDIRTANTEREAVTGLDSDVDVVLLDRRMPDGGGEAVLDAVEDRGLDCRVALVTGTSPDVSIVDLSIDEYVQKPVDRRTLLTTVERLVTRLSYCDRVREYFAAVRKRELLRTELETAELVSNPTYAGLERRIDELRTDLTTLTEQLDDGDFEALFRDLQTPAGT